MQDGDGMQELTCKYCGSSQCETRPHELHGAGAYCSSCGRWIKWLGKARTPEEQAKRQARKRIYQQEYMAGQDPTKPQTDYLNKLGYRGYVGSRLHAYNLIEDRAGDHNG